MGILNTNKMCKLYRSTLLPTANKFYGKIQTSLLEDRDPTKTNITCATLGKTKKEFNKYNGQRPLQSSVCNPVENFWAIIQARLRRKHFRNLKQLTKSEERQ